MAGRFLTIPLVSTALATAKQDIFAAKAGAANGIILHWIHLDSTNTTPAPLYMTLQRATTITLGSGGTVITPAPLDVSNGFSVTGTYHVDDTTPSASTFTALKPFIWDTVLPFDYLPAPEHRVQVAGGEGFALTNLATIVAATVAGFTIVEEC